MPYRALEHFPLILMHNLRKKVAHSCKQACTNERTNSVPEVRYRSPSCFSQQCFELLKNNSIGLKSGEYEGR